MFKSKLVLASLITAAFSLSACSAIQQSRTQPAPTENHKVKVNVTSDRLFRVIDLPINAYRVNDSQTIITGDDNRAATKAQAPKLAMDLRQASEVYLNRQLNQAKYRKRFTTSSQPAFMDLNVSTAVVFSHLTDQLLRPYVVVRAKLILNDTGRQLWETQYIASAGKPLPLTGDNSWTDDKTTELGKQVNALLKQALNTLLEDIRSPALRDDKTLTTVTAWVPFERLAMQMSGYKLWENSEYLVFTPKIADIRDIAGVHILDKAVTKQRPTEEGDELKGVEYFQIGE